MSEKDRGDTVENRSEKANSTMAGPCQTTAQDRGGDPTPQQWLTAEKGQAGDEGGGS